MGLGKTIQVMAVLSVLYHYSQALGPNYPSIIVCPTTVLKQWMQEHHRNPDSDTMPTIKQFKV
ncbi:DNA repair protein rhp26 [Mucor circinelloides]